jgi:hypothetical protein
VAACRPARYAAPDTVMAALGSSVEMALGGFRAAAGVGPSG